MKLLVFVCEGSGAGPRSSQGLLLAASERNLSALKLSAAKDSFDFEPRDETFSLWHRRGKIIALRHSTRGFDGRKKNRKINATGGATKKMRLKGHPERGSQSAEKSSSNTTQAETE